MNIVRRKLRAVLVPLAVVVLVLSAALPASADDGTTPAAPDTAIHTILPFSLNW